MTIKWKCLLTGFVSVLLLLPGVAWSGIWVGVQGGLTYIPSTDIDVKVEVRLGDTYKNVKFDTNFMGGLILGYDFNNEGFLGRAWWPSCMKYFSLALDATYETISFKAQNVMVATQGNNNIPPRLEPGISPSGNISTFTLTPMIIGKYGFIRSEEIPFGRLQPYLGVGAGIMITNPSIDGLETSQKNKTDISVLFEGGLRYMLLQNLSLDAAFRYRMIPTNFGNMYTAFGDTEPVNIDFDPDLLSGILRLSYHF